VTAEGPAPCTGRQPSEILASRPSQDLPQPPADDGCAAPVADRIHALDWLRSKLQEPDRGSWRGLPVFDRALDELRSTLQEWARPGSWRGLLVSDRRRSAAQQLQESARHGPLAWVAGVRSRASPR
jgi:hypothetical protein